jgi:hypothetical protein
MSSSRQIRLIGEPAQKKLSAAKAQLRQSGLAGWVEERYLVGAGVRAPTPVPRNDHRFADLDPAARDVALGAASALDTIREILRD